MIYALDTNTIIHLLQDNPAVSKCFDDAVEAGTVMIPPYVNYEVLRGFQYIPAPRKEKLYNDLCSRCQVGEMNTDAWKKAAALYGDLRYKRFTVDDADLLIAAFCIVNGYILVTNNIKHFNVIEGLQIEDWTV